MTTICLPWGLRRVCRARDADGCWCPTCGMYADSISEQSVPWTWRNVMGMHHRGTGHTMILTTRTWETR